jgi:3-hydroxyisobutyrate dehydrogenase-like beta-hydroxyacid dehydrogenase
VAVGGSDNVSVRKGNGYSVIARGEAGDLDQLENLLRNATNPGALAEADMDRVRELLGEGAAGSRLVKTKIPKMAAGDFSPQFQLGLMEKDLRYFLGLAQELDRPVPVAALVRSQMQAARRAGLGTQDVSALFAHITGPR